MTRIELFNKLIKILETNNIRYAITGRTEDYPAAIGSDIDIVVPREQIELFNKSLWYIEDEETHIVQMFQHECVALYYMVFHIKSNSVICIQPDVCTDYYRNGRKLLSADYMLNGIREATQGGFNVLASEKEFIYYLLKKIDKRNLSKNQFVHIRNSFITDSSKAVDEAKRFWNDSYVAIIKNAFENNDYALLNNNLKGLQDGIHESSKRSIVDNIRNVALKVKRIIYPTGYVIAILGPDGSGKTTVINQVKEDIAPAFRNIQQFHLFPVIKDGEDKVNDNPHGKKKRGFIMSVAKLLYFVWIYANGHIRYVLPKMIRSTLTIFDRYYDDIIIDPARYRNGTPEWVVKFFRLLIPEPNFWIILDCPTDVIQARKAEVTLEETERQRQAYLDFAKTKKNCIVLNTNRDVQEISADACRFICESLHKRAVKRYKI